MRQAVSVSLADLGFCLATASVRERYGFQNESGTYEFVNTV